MRRISSISVWQKAIIPTVFSCRFRKLRGPVLNKPGAPGNEVEPSVFRKKIVKKHFDPRRLGHSGTEPFACDDDLKGWHDEFIIGGSWETWLAVRNEIMTCKHPCRRQLLRVLKNKLIPPHLICADRNIPVCSRFIPFNGELIRRQSSTPDPRWRGWPWGLIECCWWGKQNTISKEQKNSKLQKSTVKSWLWKTDMLEVSAF